MLCLYLLVYRYFVVEDTSEDYIIMLVVLSVGNGVWNVWNKICLSKII